jgi:hypothetical protein
VHLAALPGLACQLVILVDDLEYLRSLFVDHKKYI